MDPFHAKIVAAATGSTITALTMTPFDVVKTRLQTQPPPSQSRPLFPRPPPNSCCLTTKSAPPCLRGISSIAHPTSGEVVCLWDHGVLRTERVNGFYDAVRHVWKAEGARGLWKGAGTSLLIGIPSSTAYILAYDHLLKVFLPAFLPSGPVVPLAAGVIARTGIATLGSPLELVRTNLQSTPISPDKPHTLRSVLTSIQALVRERGVSFLWKGLGPTLWRDVPFSGIYWASYEACKQAFTRRGHSGSSVAFVSGAGSGILAAVIVSPFDVLKTRRQALLMAPLSNDITSTMPLLAQIVRTEGIAALFAGLMPRMAKIAPACGIMITCYEGIGSMLAQKH